MDKLPEVRAFIYYDFQTAYYNTKFVKVEGKSPEMIFYSDCGQVLKRFGIADKTRLELNEIMAEHGFEKVDPVERRRVALEELKKEREAKAEMEARNREQMRKMDQRYSHSDHHDDDYDEDDEDEENGLKIEL